MAEHRSVPFNKKGRAFWKRTRPELRTRKMITRQIPPAQLLFALSNPMTPRRIKKMRRARLLKRFALILTVAAITACAMIGG